MSENIVVVWDGQETLYPVTHYHECDPKCTICGKQFTVYQQQQHNLWEENSQQLTTENIAPENEELRSPLQEAQKRYQCEQCDERFVRKAQLKRHKYTHTEDRIYKCTECDKGFAKDITLKQHMKKHDLTNRQCPVCDKICDQAASLKVHMVTHTGERNYPCTVCGRPFKTLGCMKKHIFVHSELTEKRLNKHKYKKYRNCPECNKPTSDLEQHMLTHTGEKNFKCTECERSFARKTVLDCHMYYKHSEERRFQCTVCEKKFKTQHNVKQHMHTHSTERKFKCSLCDKTFYKSERLKRHMVLHTGEKDHQCPICNRAFSRFNIKRHMLLHNTEKNFQCKECLEWFSTDGNLRRHLLSHNIGKRHKCTLCEKSYTRNADLNRHMKSHKDEDKRVTQNNSMLTNTEQGESNSLPGQTQNASLPTQSESARLPTQTESASVYRQPQSVSLLKTTQTPSSNSKKPTPTIVIFPGNYILVKDDNS